MTIRVEEKEEVKVELPSKEERIARQQMIHAEGGQKGTVETEEAGAEAVPEEKKALPEESKPTASKNVEEPIVSEFAQNNYWRNDLAYSLKQLETDYA